MNGIVSFTPPPYLKNQHLQSFMNSQGPRRLRAWLIQRKLVTETVELEAEDGTRLLGEFDRAAAGNGGLVVLLHGWEGSSRSAYLVTTAEKMLAAGFDVLRLNFRDHGDSHHLNRELFNSTRVPEIISALKGFINKRDYPQVFLAGFSLGGNFALRIAADSASELRISAAVAVCPPVDPAHVMVRLNRFYIYEKYFFRKWYKSLSQKLRLFPDLDYGSELASATTIDDLNAFFVPFFTPYKKVADYFAAYALIGNRLQNLAIPSFLITAEDDPLIPVEDLEKINVPKQLHIEKYAHGGHCAFVEDIAGNSWIESRLLTIFSGLLRKQNPASH